MRYLVISLGGVLGANARYLLGNWVAARYGTSFPYGTMLINVSGSFVIGFFLVLITERFVVHPNWRHSVSKPLRLCRVVPGGWLWPI